MKSEDKELLKQELIKYNRKNYSGNSVKTISIELISWLANDFKDRKHAVRLLVENEYGLLGNLLFKYMREPDEEIRELITELDTKLVKDAYRRFGELLITDGNGGSSFCLKVLLKEHPKLVSILSLMQGYSIEEEDAYEIAPYCPQVIGVVSPSHKWERKFVKQMTRINPCCIEYADRKFKSDSEIARNCVLDNPEMIRCVDMVFREDRELIKRAVKHRGLLLSYASDELKDDYEIVKTAVEANGLALRYASERLQRDEGLIQLAENYRREWDGNDK